MGYLLKKVVTASFSHPEMGALGLAGLAWVLREEVLGKAQYNCISNFGSAGHSWKVDDVVRYPSQYALAVIR